MTREASQAAWGQTAEGVEALRAEAGAATAAKDKAEKEAADLRARLGETEAALAGLREEVRSDR